jgi:hypothetical protein
MSHKIILAKTILTSFISIRQTFFFHQYYLQDIRERQNFIILFQTIPRKINVLGIPFQIIPRKIKMLRIPFRTISQERKTLRISFRTNKRKKTVWKLRWCLRDAFFNLSNEKYFLFIFMLSIPSNLISSRNSFRSESRNELFRDTRNSAEWAFFRGITKTVPESIPRNFFGTDFR